MELLFHNYLNGYQISNVGSQTGVAVFFLLSRLKLLLQALGKTLPMADVQRNPKQLEMQQSTAGKLEDRN